MHHEINAIGAHCVFPGRRLRYGGGSRPVRARRSVPEHEVQAIRVTDSDPTAGLERLAAFDRAQRHSRRVRRLKVALPALAVLLIAGFGVVAFIARQAPGLGIQSVLIEDGRIVMQNPRVNGLTGGNKPYVVEAARAFQSVSDANDIALEGITARLPYAGEVFADLEAARGHLDNTARILKLDGGFTFITEDGLTAKMEAATLDLVGRGLVSEKPVDITSPGTHIRADSMRIGDGGAEMVFERKVRMVIQPSMLGKPSTSGNPASPGKPAAATPSGQQP